MDNNLTMQELLDMQEEELSKINVGEEITGTVETIRDDELVLKLDLGFDGVIPVSDLNLPKGTSIEDAYKVGEEVSGIITKINLKDTTVVISKSSLDQARDLKELEEIFEEGKTITIHIDKNIERGIFGKYKSQTIFIPISQIDTKFVTDTSEYVGQDLEVYIKELNSRRNKVVASHRQLLQEKINIERKERRERIKAEREAERERRKAEREKKKAEREALFESLEVGQKINGKVTNIMPYGAFIDLGGIEGLAHINNLSWKRVPSVESVLEEGQNVDVYIMDKNPENMRIALAVKDINNDPWDLAADELSVGDIVNVEVLRIIESGAFVEVKEGVEAYLPIGELKDERVGKVEDVISEGDKLSVRIKSFNPADKRMLVSLKEANREPVVKDEEEDIAEYLESDEKLGNIGELLGDQLEGALKSEDE